MRVDLSINGIQNADVIEEIGSYLGTLANATQGSRHGRFVL